MEGENEERKSGVVSLTFNVNQGALIEREEDGKIIREPICGRCLNKSLENEKDPSERGRLEGASTIEKKGLSRHQCSRCPRIIEI